MDELDTAYKVGQLSYLTRESLKRRQIDELWKAKRATSPASLSQVLVSEDASSRSTSRSIWSARLENARSSAFGMPWSSRLPCRSAAVHSTPQRPGQLALVAGAVDGVGGQPVPVQVPAVQGRPAAVRTLDAVGDHQVGV
jgi:hypothetical protein